MPHTPGPWTRNLFIEAMDEGIANGDISGEVVSMWTPQMRSLHAAAPDLLAALKGIVDDFEAKTDASASSYWLPKWEAARAAIAKAEGR